jgi:hypothetical protein
MQTLLHHPLPNAYQFLQTFGPSGRCYRRRDGLTVVETTAPQKDGNEWLHISLSFPDHLPSYEDMKQVKAIFAGDENTALQIFPPKSRHVNIHEYCLHLWVCLTDDPIPEFGDEGTI